MSTELLNWVCDLSGKSDEKFVEFLNNRNTIPPSVVYILMMRSAVNHVMACINAGFVLDENCMSIACIMKNLELIKLCIDTGLKPAENNINNVIIQCVNTGKNYGYYGYYGGTDITNFTHEDICDENKFFKLIVEIATGGSCRCGDYNHDHYRPTSSIDYCYDGLKTLLNKFPKISGCRNNIMCKPHVNSTIECLNYLLNDGYTMTVNNWELFNKTLINIKNINICMDDKESYAMTICSTNNYGTVNYIEKKK